MGCGVGDPSNAKTIKKNIYIKIFLRKGLRSLSPNFHIQVSVSNLYVPTIGLPILPQENMWTDPGNIYKSLTDT